MVVQGETKQTSVPFVMAQMLKLVAAVQGSDKLGCFIVAHTCLLMAEEFW